MRLASAQLGEVRMRQRLRSHLTYANVMATIAVFLVLSGGTAVALTGSNTVFSDDIVNGEVKAADIGTNAVGSGKIVDGGVQGVDILDGTVDSPDILDGAVSNKRRPQERDHFGEGAGRVARRHRRPQRLAHRSRYGGVESRQGPVRIQRRLRIQRELPERQDRRRVDDGAHWQAESSVDWLRRGWASRRTSNLSRSAPEIANNREIVGLGRAAA